VIGLADVRDLDAPAATVVDALEPDAISLRDAVPMWDALDAAQRKISAAKTLLARRVDESGAWQRAGHRTAAEFMAARSGSSIGSARVQLRPSDPGWALVEGTGNRPMVRPGDPRHPKNKPKWDSG
jgi:hypothetical protein